MLKSYLKKIFKTANQGDAREESYYATLEELFKKIAQSFGKGFILGFYEAFSQFLISGLSKEEFADLYSQTITYGLFAARMRAKNGFNRKLAYDNIPRTIEILRDVFRFVSLEDVPTQMEWSPNPDSGRVKNLLKIKRTFRFFSSLALNRMCINHCSNLRFILHLCYSCETLLKKIIIRRLFNLLLLIKCRHQDVHTDTHFDHYIDML